MSNYPQRIFNHILDTLFPKTCLGCGKFTTVDDFDYICKKCFGGIEIRNTFECIGCKRQTRIGLTCVHCEKENHVDQLIVVANLSDPLVDKAIKAYKYKFVSSMAKPLSVLAGRSVRKLLPKGCNLLGDSPLLVSVPLHKNRLNWRGFNQAWLIAKNLADRFLVSCDEKVLTRISYSRNQADISVKEERVNNVRKVFEIASPRLIKGQTVILVDDICTTGATLNECARVLKENGARKVVGFVIARG